MNLQLAIGLAKVIVFYKGIVAQSKWDRTANSNRSLTLSLGTSLNLGAGGAWIAAWATASWPARLAKAPWPPFPPRRDPRRFPACMNSAPLGWFGPGVGSSPAVPAVCHGLG